MAVTWITSRGSLGTVPENQFFSYQLEALDSDEQPLTYSFHSGVLPPGLYVTRDGILRGIPAILDPVPQNAVYAFTIRAITPNGLLADRSFSLNVTNVTGPLIIPRVTLIGAWFDGSFLDYTFQSINDNPVANQTWTITKGEIPPGTTLSTNGRLSGFVDIIAANYTDLGFEAAPIETVIFDALPQSTDKYYNFTIQVTDGVKYDAINVRLLIVSKGNFTADNTITVINNTFITIDADNKYRPIILNDPGSLPVLVAGSTFAYKFIAYDPEDEDVSWNIDELAFSGMDDLDAAQIQLISGNGSSGPYILDLVPIDATRITVRVNNVLLTANIDYTVISDELTFVSLSPGPLESIEIQFISTLTGYDTLLFDQGSSTLPSGLTIDPDTGWVTGVLPTQTEDIKTYSFNVTAFRTLFPTFISDPVTFSLQVKRTLNEEIVWNTNMDLGVIDNGAISELAVSATNTLGKELEYFIIYQPFRRIPQGLKFLKSGRFTGRVSFRYFSLDGQTAYLNFLSTQNLEVGMSVQGVGVAAGCEITAIIDDNTIEVQPAIYVTQGSILSFSDETTTISLSTVSNAVSTIIDGGRTTFDQECGFTVKAVSKDQSISSTKSFLVKVRPRNLAPYENVFLKALPKPSQRELLQSVLKDESIFPTELLYRPDDAYFGLQRNLKFLFVPGLSASNAQTFVNAIANNHYFKNINFGDVKTARALNSDGSVAYEVVYVDVVDTLAYSTIGPPESINLTTANKFLYGQSQYDVIYPNSFTNMQKRLSTSLGYTNRGAIPKWMLSVQENGRVLGLIRAVVLAYTQPSASKLIAYRLKNSGFKLNSIAFVADRYQWDNHLSKFYNTTTNSFEPSRSTTFDKYPSLGSGSSYVNTIITTNVTNSNNIVIPSGVVVGAGWKVIAQDFSAQIPLGTTLVNLNGTTLTLSSNVTATAGSAIRIDGQVQVDYSLNKAFDVVNGALLSYARSSFLIDGVPNFSEDETLIFYQQFGFDVGLVNDGWVESDGVTTIPGYLEKLSGQSSVNKRGGVWKINWTPLPTSGFDDDTIGFDGVSTNLTNSYFDQSDDSEIYLTFVQEIILNQTVKVRTGDSYPGTTLQYLVPAGQVVPYYIPFDFATGIERTAETTFDGGTCVMRAGYVNFSQSNATTSGTTFSNNRDKYVIPETQDKYIKFPQDGVFV